jgi:aspartate-semialdehyde dehydrogenase
MSNHTTSTTSSHHHPLLHPPSSGKKVGVVGVTGAVGKEMLRVLQQRKWKLDTNSSGGGGEIRTFASERSANTVVDVDGIQYKVEAFSIDRCKDLDVIFLAVSGEFSLEYSRVLAKLGPLVIDNSSALRYDDDIVLVVPEVNGERDLPQLLPGARIVANPNCTTAIAVMALAPLHERFHIKRLIVSTYQAASGAGVQGMEELDLQMKQYARGEEIQKPKTFPQQLALNLFPHIDKFMENGYTKEEMKVVWECRKIMGLPLLPVSCTAVRIPIMRAHSEAITIETEQACSPIEARKVLLNAPGVRLVDDVQKHLYPMPLTSSGCDDVEVGRIRQSLVFGDKGLDFFVSGDQLLRGAALNAVLIGEMVFALEHGDGGNKRVKVG